MVAMAAVREAPRIARALQERREQAARDGGAPPGGAPPGGAGRGGAPAGPRSRASAARGRAEDRAEGPVPRPPHRPPTTRRSADVARSVSYAPVRDGDADPGEVVWTWVPYEEAPDEGKDRPVLVAGRVGEDVLCLLLSTRDHDGDDGWVRLGSGAWDSRGRTSWVRLDRVLQVDPDGVRREGAVLDRGRFDEVARRLRSDHGWR